MVINVKKRQRHGDKCQKSVFSPLSLIALSFPYAVSLSKLLKRLNCIFCEVDLYCDFRIKNGGKSGNL